MVSTLIIGNLNSPANLLKSKSANGFLKAPLAYMGISWESEKRVETRGLLRFAAVHNEAQFRLAAQQVKGDFCALHKIFT
jgi:hypothetical protein